MPLLNWHPPPRLRPALDARRWNKSVMPCTCRKACIESFRPEVRPHAPWKWLQSGLNASALWLPQFQKSSASPTTGAIVKVS